MPASSPICRCCRAALHDTFLDLGTTPLCESYVAADALDRPETYYPLHAWVCRECFLVQLGSFASPEEIFGEYAYFSSYSDSWVAHAKQYAGDVSARFALDRRSRVVEIGSNDGYLLQHFVARGFDVLGVEPATNVAAVARANGIPTETRFFGPETARWLIQAGRPADLVIVNNVLAQIPDLNGFVAGLATLLGPAGVLTIEVPHVVELIDQVQFDTIYHEHFSYFSLLTLERVLSGAGLSVFDVDTLPTHGGSLRVYAEHQTAGRGTTERLHALRRRERVADIGRLQTYAGFGPRVDAIRSQLLAFLINAKRRGARVVGYGAPGKANTLLNYCHIGPDLLEFTVDRNPYKQGKYTPGMHIPIHSPDRIAFVRPDYLLVLPWNLKEEIMSQMAGIRGWGGKFVVAIPRVEVIA